MAWVLAGCFTCFAKAEALHQMLKTSWAQEVSDEKTYLRHLLKELNISEHSQVLVFSKTSHQLAQISPETPRAIYFNENYYVGYVQRGLIELIEQDPVHGTKFYTLQRPQLPNEKPLLVEDASCVSCHESHHDFDVPGLMVRSVFPLKNGQPILTLGSYRTTTKSPVSERWGGWWVTGNIENSEHLGNRFFQPHDSQNSMLAQLSEQVDLKPYLVNTSDVLALMILEHQSEFHNLLAMCRRDVVEALERDKAWREVTKEKQSENPVLQRILKERAAKIVDLLLFRNEAELPESGLQGDIAFETAFLEGAILTPEGRSLRDLQLNDRLFKHRCSFMIYNAAFKQLPAPLFEEIKQLLGAALRGERAEYDYLSSRERERLLEILEATAPFLGSLREKK